MSVERSLGSPVTPLPQSKSRLPPFLELQLTYEAGKDTAMSEIWNEEAIGKVCSKVSLMGIPPFYVTAPDKMEGVSWIIAPYRDLRHDNDELRNILDELGVRFGQRRTDVAPHGDRVARIGERMTAIQEKQYSKFPSIRRTQAESLA